MTLASGDNIVDFAQRLSWGGDQCRNLCVSLCIYNNTLVSNNVNMCASCG